MSYLFRHSAFLILVSVCLVLSASEAFAHGGDYPKSPPGEGGAIAPPIEGSEKFAKALSAQGRGLLTEPQVDALSAVLRHFRFSEEIRSGRYHEATLEDAEYNRFRAELILCDLVDEISEPLVFDFRPGGSLPDAFAVIPFDAQTSCLLYKVETGSTGKQFLVQEFDMREERYGNHYEVPVLADGTTYILQEISEPPLGKSSTHIALRRSAEEAPFFWHALTLEIPPMGQLKIRITDKDDQPIPAMVRLAAIPSGKLWTPAGAVDLSPMLNAVTGTSIDMLPGMNIYGPDGAFEVRMPGEYAGYYWIMPGPFEMDLPEGEWELTVFRGIETVPVRETFKISSGEWTTKTIQLERWADMAARGWYSGDDHVHSRMRSSEDSGKLLAFTQAMDIRVSNILEMGDPQRTYYIQRGFGPEFRVEKEGYHLIPGQEDPRSILGHNIGLNLMHLARDLDHYLLLDWVADNIHEQGGLFGQTHVGQNVCEAHRGMALMVPREVYDFYSIMQGSLGTELYYDFLDLGYKLTASAGSDMPYAGSLGNVRLYAFVGEEIPFSANAWFEAIKAGHTFVTNGPMIEFTIDEAIPGDSLSFGSEEIVTVKARAWGLSGQSEPVRLEIVKLSEVIKSAAKEDSDSNELSLSFSIPVTESFWIAARTYADNGSVAHTTPIYVERAGERHWNPDRARGIILKQLSILDEIEGVIAAAEESKRNGTMIALDFWAVRSIEQAEPLRQRLEITRGIYEALLSELDNVVLPATVTPKPGL